jgi:hypothetical protein
VERREVAERELRERPRGALVPVDHDARRVTRPVRDPGLGSVVRERHRDEHASEIVKADLTALVGGLEEFRPLLVEADRAKVRA